MPLLFRFRRRSIHTLAVQTRIATSRWNLPTAPRLSSQPRLVPLAVPGAGAAASRMAAPHQPNLCSTFRFHNILEKEIDESWFPPLAHETAPSQH